MRGNQQRTKGKRIALAAALLLAFSGCTPSVAPAEPTDFPGGNWRASHSPIPARRTGIAQQGIYTRQNGFESTDAGAYIMCDLPAEDGWFAYLLYCDHDSDTVVKLCGRPDCDHNGKDCNAYFPGGFNICFFDGYLYTTQSIKSVLFISGTSPKERNHKCSSHRNTLPCGQ